MDYLRVLYLARRHAALPAVRARRRAAARSRSPTGWRACPPARASSSSPRSRASARATTPTCSSRPAQDGFTRARIDGEMVRAARAPRRCPSWPRAQPHTIELIVDRLVVPAVTDDAERRRARTSPRALIDSVETTLRAGKGLLHRRPVATARSCCSASTTPARTATSACPSSRPALFSFNSPSGMCPDCNGLGTQAGGRPGLIVEHPELSLLDGASRWYGNMRKKKQAGTCNHLQAMADHYGVDLELPWKDLPQKFRDVILYGSGDEKIHFNWENQRRHLEGRRQPPGARRGLPHQPPVPPDPVRIHPALVHQLYEPAALPHLRRRAPVRRSAPRHRRRQDLPRGAGHDHRARPTTG